MATSRGLEFPAGLPSVAPPARRGPGAQGTGRASSPPVTWPMLSGQPQSIGITRRFSSDYGTYFGAELANVTDGSERAAFSPAHQGASRRANSQYRRGAPGPQAA